MSTTDTIIRKLEIAPGINKNTTELDAEGTYVCCDKTRFFYGLPEKIGGWVREQYEGSITGVARDVHTWIDLRENKYFGIGTNTSLYVFNNGTVSDITPITASACGSNVFSIASGSDFVTLSVNPEGRQAGDYFILTCASTSIAGINFTPGTRYLITSVDTGFIQFQTDVCATASVSSGGGVFKIDYLLESGLQSNGAAFGWGAGTWDTPGVSTCAGWSEPRGEGTEVFLRQWSLDNWGEDFVANPQGGAIYYWKSSAGVTERASVISSAAPSIVNSMVIAQEGRHVIAFGTHTIGGDFDPLLVRWSDSEDYNTWVAAATNQAGSFRIENGSYIIGPVETRREILVFTDESVYSMQRTGGQLVFTFSDLGKYNGLVSLHGAVDVNGIVYWWAFNSFQNYNGVLNTLPCTLHEAIFNTDSPFSLNFDQREKVYCETNKAFNEIWWFYPSKFSDEIDRYVVFNYLENLWYHGTINRTVFHDTDIFEKPYAIDEEGQIFIHETGKNDDAGNLKAYLHTSYFDLEDGDKLMFVDRIIPDHTISKELNYQINYKKYPQSDEVFTKGPYQVEPATRKFHPRIRGRQGQIVYSTSVTDSFFRLGSDRVALKEDGKR